MSIFLKKCFKVVFTDLKHECPECKCKNLIVDKDIIYCSDCGLIVQSVYGYVGGQRIVLPYGLFV